MKAGATLPSRAILKLSQRSDMRLDVSRDETRTEGGMAHTLTTITVKPQHI